jgi:broad specificity phosphatase PhoE
MTKTIYLIRHAEAEHNVAFNIYGETAYESHTFRDADLTLNGINQAENVEFKLNVVPFQVVFTSPLTRALHTTSIIFKNQYIPIIAREDIRERYDRHPANNRKSIDKLKQLYTFFDFSEITNNEDILYNTPDDLVARTKSFINYLVSRPETVIAIVSHETFLKQLLSYFNVADTSLKNCEYKCVILN